MSDILEIFHFIGRKPDIEPLTSWMERLYIVSIPITVIVRFQLPTVPLENNTPCQRSVENDLTTMGSTGQVEISFSFILRYQTPG